MRTNITLLIMMAAACGGSPKSGLNKGGDVPPPPSITKAADVQPGKPAGAKVEISKDARSDYSAAVGYFNTNDKGTWNEAQCRSAADKFTSVVREHPDLVAAQFMAGLS